MGILNGKTSKEYDALKVSALLALNNTAIKIKIECISYSSRLICDLRHFSRNKNSLIWEWRSCPDCLKEDWEYVWTIFRGRTKVKYSKSILMPLWNKLSPSNGGILMKNFLPSNSVLIWSCIKELSPPSWLCSRLRREFNKYIKHMKLIISIVSAMLKL